MLQGIRSRRQQFQARFMQDIWHTSRMISDGNPTALRGIVAGCVLALAVGWGGRPAVAGPAAAPLEVFVVAHADDWQLFMGDVAARALRSGRPTIFVYTTAGDGGRSAAYWLAREQGALTSVRVALGAAPPSDEPVACADTRVEGRSVRRCRLGTTASYFLRLPDGNARGQGFAATGERSLSGLSAGATVTLAPLEGEGAYAGWGDLVRVVAAIVRQEASGAGAAGESVRLHAPDPDPAFNPWDHADHRATGQLAAEIARGGGYALTRYAGYSTADWPENLSEAQVSDKARLFMAYGGATALDDPEWSAYAKAPRLYSAWLWRTYVRPADFPGHSR